MAERNKIIGIVKGKGIGEEIMDSCLLCLNEIEKISKHKFQIIKYNGHLSPVNDALRDLRKFYSQIIEKNGVILRSSIYAPVVYKLRQDFDLFYKLVFLKPIPELIYNSPLKEEIINEIDVVLLRDNNVGPYHGEFWKKSVNGENKFGCSFYYTKSHVMNISRKAFELASLRKKKVHLFIKYPVLGYIGELWINTFNEIHREYSKIEFQILSPDCGNGEIFINPQKFDVIVALDTEADILADQLATLLYGTRGLTPSVNFNNNGFGTYQTIHGTGDKLKGKDIASPLAMLNATALMLDLSFNLKHEANILCQAIKKVLKDGYRTEDIFKANIKGLKKVGTKEITKLIIENLHQISTIYYEKSSTVYC